MEVTRVVVAALFGCLGAVVSLLMRLAEFDKTRGKSKEFLILSGGTQPLVGGIFAAVVASIIVSEVVTVAGTPQNCGSLLLLGSSPDLVSDLLAAC